MHQTISKSCQCNSTVKHINSLSINGTVSENQEEKRDNIVNFYKALYSESVEHIPFFLNLPLNTMCQVDKLALEFFLNKRSLWQ